MGNASLAETPDAIATAREGAGSWTAIVLAGQRPGRDPLAQAFGETYKAVVPIAGEPMLGRVLRTMLEAPSIGQVIVLAQAPEALLSGPLAWAAAHQRIVPLVGGGGIARSIEHVAGGPQAPWPVLVTTADHPLLSAEMVEDFIARAGDDDIAIGAVERATVVAQYPEVRRTWLKFRDGAYSGANLFALRGARTAAALRLWAKAEHDRKSALHLFMHFGPWLAIRAITRTIGFASAVRSAGRNLGVSARLVELPWADAAIDVDKPSDHSLAEAILQARSGAPAELEHRARLSVFDLDRTLTRKPTYTAFLLFAARRRSPWRLFLAPAVIGCMLAYLAGLISRRRVKELEQQLLLGRNVPRTDIDALARAFASRIASDGIYPEAIARIARERAEGRRVILATAANAFYLDAIAAAIGIGEVVATRSAWLNDRLLARIDGENCYGSAKRDMLASYLADCHLPRAQASVRFFSDHVSDRPTFEWADEPIAINPSRKLRKLAKGRGWPILSWH